MSARSELKSLRAYRDYPSVSILAPTHRIAPSNKQDPIKVKNLVRKAIDRFTASSKNASLRLTDVYGEIIEDILT